MEEANQNDIEEPVPESILNRHRSKGKFSCLSCSPPNCDHPTVCHKAVKCYTAHVRDTDGYEHKSKGCTRNIEQTMLHCATLRHDGAAFHARNNKSGQIAFDCCEGNMCNENTTFPELPPVPVIQPEEIEDEETSEVNALFIVLAVVVVMFMIAILTICCLKRRHKKRTEKIAKDTALLNGDLNDMELRVQCVGNSTLAELQQDSFEDSGSGSGMAQLCHRSYARDIALHEQIGKGRFGVEVWKGTWNGTTLVAVKCFTSRDEVSYQRETKIYSIPLLHHPNILIYHGSDLWSSNGCSYNWIVTKYHPDGSLYDFLNRVQSITVQMAYDLIMGALKGLSHLHTNIQGKPTKPFIAHRDIKSKNILVDRGDRGDQLSAVVADFGLALTESEFQEMELTEENVRVGTKRYMSPEVLDLSILQRTDDFEAFLQSDMYSFGLVIWEILRKTQLDEFDPKSADDYALPYFADVNPDPSFEEMRKVICGEYGNRPGIPKKWKNNTVIFLNSFSLFTQRF